MLSKSIAKLVQYGIQTGLLPECEKRYAVNLLLDCFHENNYAEPESIEFEPNLEVILNELLEEAISRNLIADTITERDLFDTRLMNTLVPRPFQIQQTFRELYKTSPELATSYFYKLSQDSNYIRRYRIKKDLKWNFESEYGIMEITINVSKPEKDPREIAAAKSSSPNTYPDCPLCFENEGYAGHKNYPARENHRILPVTLDTTCFGFQYSPYLYYKEHCIVFHVQHTPMKINRTTFIRLFDFVKQFPHYFLGSNADLPIVGGSILSHDHFQGGNHIFAMAKAPIEMHFTIPGYEDIETGIVKWPVSVIRIRHHDEKRLIDLASHILKTWRDYTDEDAFIFSKSGGEFHNTVTPIARKVHDLFELDLALRNNITTKEYPLGVFHPHSEYHPIKKENIGLIEIMGLAILPARLLDEMNLIKEAILNKKDISSIKKIQKHAPWVLEILSNYPSITEENISEILKQEIGKVFVHVLENAGVFKRTPEGRRSFLKFLKVL